MTTKNMMINISGLIPPPDPLTGARELDGVSAAVGAWSEVSSWKLNSLANR